LLLIFGGAVCEPSCKVQNTLVAVDVGDGSGVVNSTVGWRALTSPDTTSAGSPLPRYRHTFVARRGRGVVFGGESYSPAQ
jgi:hypothetical protein